MRVFKHLIALADIAVGFLGLFFIIFAVTRPSLQETVAALKEKQDEIAHLRQTLQVLEDLHLVQSATGKPLSREDISKIILARHEIRVEVSEDKSVFSDLKAFQLATAKIAWPSVVVLYVDRRVAFEIVVKVIDRLKQIRPEISVRVAVLPE